MSVSLRNRRFEVYTLTETTTDGVVSKRYVLVGEYWGRLVPPSGREVTLGLGAGHTVDGVIALHEEVTVSEDGVLVDDADQVFEVRAVLPRPMLAEQHIVVERSSEAVGTYTLALS